MQTDRTHLGITRGKKESLGRRTKLAQLTKMAMGKGKGREKRREKRGEEEAAGKKYCPQQLVAAGGRELASPARGPPPTAARPITARRGVHGTRQESEESGFGASTTVSVFRRLVIRPCPFWPVT